MVWNQFAEDYPHAEAVARFKSRWSLQSWRGAPWSTLSRLCGEWKGWFILCIMQERAVKCRDAYRFLCCQRGRCSHPLPSCLHSAPSTRVPLLLLFFFLSYRLSHKFRISFSCSVSCSSAVLLWVVRKRTLMTPVADVLLLSPVPVCSCHMTSASRGHPVMLETS